MKIIFKLINSKVTFFIKREFLDGVV